MTSHITLILPGKECRIVHLCTIDVFFNERPLLISVNFHYLNYFCLKKVAVYFFYTYFTVPIVEIFKKKGSIIVATLNKMYLLCELYSYIIIRITRYN